ncbi:uncharacterized protein [Neodiprion pinetum]|uniref:uncharacterized protein n=1 Tax=Neodiprion pinetum TaxID=441929 RepID=UPI003716F387
MSDNKDTEEKKKVGWVYNLNAEQLKNELKTRGIPYNDTELFENLRKKVVAIVKEEISAASAKQPTITNAEIESNKTTNQNNQQDDTSGDDASFFSVSDSDTDSNMSNNQARLEFCLDTSDWEIFVERLDIRISTKKVKEEDKAGELLSRLDDDAYKLIKSLCAPEKAANKSYADLVEMMTNHLTPKPSELMERCTFNQAKQNINESVAEFAARLKKLALNCEFSDLQTSLRDQFVVGMRDDTTRVELFKTSKLTFDAALKEAIAREAAVKNASSVANTLEKRNTQRDMFALKQESKTANPYNSRRPPSKPHFGADKRDDTQNHNRPDIKCWCCGGRNHVRAKCHHKHECCGYCKGKGHLEKVCLKKHGTTRGGVNKLVGDDGELQEEEEEEEPSHTNEFFCLKTDDKSNGPILIGRQWLAAFGCWPLAIQKENTNTTAIKLINVLKSIFAKYGLPLHMVTDGGPQFRADIFLDFLRGNGVNHSFAPPYHPATNGAAENFVGTFKNKVTKIIKGGETPESAVNLFLFDYRNIAHCTTGKSPAQLMYNRDLRTRFDLLRTSVAAHVEKKQRAQIMTKPGTRQNDVIVGDTVLFDNHRVRGEKRVTGEVIKKVSPSTYVIRDSDHALAKRHIDQIVKQKKSNVPMRRSPRLNKS